ncbi:glycoside hydrolase family 97 C-terminal domain-containing protein, partial [Rhodococcus sp. PAE-6]|uniref:glycoside hydrolase family 97 C-terminal domain-containing protein n=1 Tax=Rhodococcus sp. PAE-6 TaxID=2972477 RepID=UPI0021B1B3BC
SAPQRLLSLDFLEAGKRWGAEVYRDGDGADYRGDARFRVVHEERTVSAGDVLSLWLAPGGGFAIRLLPLE